MDRFLDGSTADGLREADSAVTRLFGGEQADEDPIAIQQQPRRNKRAKSDCGPVRLTSLSADIAIRFVPRVGRPTEPGPDEQALRRARRHAAGVLVAVRGGRPSEVRGRVCVREVRGSEEGRAAAVAQVAKST